MKKPNVKGPRFRGKRISILCPKTYSEFNKKFPEHKEYKDSKFREIIMLFNKKIADTVIDNRNGVELPDSLGYLFIGTCPSPKTKKNIDFKTSAELGKTVYHKNWDSDNNLMKIFYSNQSTKYPFKNKQVWAFKASKPFRQRASKVYKENWTKYIQVPSTKKIASLFDVRTRKEKQRNSEPNIPDGYDEFNI